MKFFFTPLLLLVGCSGAPFTLAEQKLAETSTEAAAAPVEASAPAPDSSSEAAPADAPSPPLSDVDAGATSEAEAVVGPSCKSDGAHDFDIGDAGKSIHVWCQGGVSYINVSATSAFAQCGGLGTRLVTTFYRARINLDSLTLDPNDLTFSSSNGSVIAIDGATISSLPLGVAGGCNGADASAVVDISGSGLVFTKGQFGPNGSQLVSWAAIPSANRTVMTIDGSGSCAWGGPAFMTSLSAPPF